MNLTTATYQDLPPPMASDVGCSDPCCDALRAQDPGLWAALAAVVQATCAARCGFHPTALGPQAWAWAQADLVALEAVLQGRDLAALPNVPPRAVRRRQLAFVAGRLCARVALLQAGATGPCAVARGDSGQPLWPDGWSGSITHTSRSARVVVARRQGHFDLGLDAEPLIQPATQPAVLQTCVHDSERPLLAAAASPQLALTALFSAKEAYYKAVYRHVRRFIDFKQVALSGWSAPEGRFQIGPAPDAPETGGWPQTQGWFAEQGGEVITVLGPGYG